MLSTAALTCICAMLSRPLHNLLQCELSDMALKRMLMQMGMGTDLRGQDYTKAAVRGLQDAVRHNSISVAPALGYPREAMHVVVQVGVAHPKEVDTEAVAAVLPYGTSEVKVVQGGLDVLSDDGSGTTVVANVSAVVYLDIDEGER